MADRPPSDENMAVSQDPGVSQQNLKESNKEETDLRGAQSNSKMDAPKKKTFKITSVTKSSQRGGSGDLTQDNDGDSIDDLDETVDSHTEDLSSEMYDCSKATDLDGQDALLTPEEVIKEKPARFKVVKIGTKETFRRGRWTCYDYPDAPEKPEKVEPKPEESHAAGGVQNSVHYGHGFDDPLKNPLLAGATGTMPSHQSSGPADSMSGTTKGPGESQSRQSSLSGIAQHSNQAGQSVQNAIATYSNHVAQSMPAYSVANALPYSTKGGQQVPAYSMQGMVPGQSIGQPGPSGQPLRAGMSAPNLPQQQTGGQTVTSQSVAGSIQGTQQQPPQQQPGSQASTIPANVHSQPAPASGAAQASQPQVPGAMQRGEYMNSAAQSMGQPPPSQQSAQQQQQQQPVYDATAQQPGGGYNLVSSGSGALPNLQNAMTTSTTDTSMEPGTAVDPKSVSAAPSQTAITPGHLDGNEIGDDMLGLGPGLEPLQIAVGGITNPNPEDDITTEEAFLEFFSLNNFGGSGLLLPPVMDDTGVNIIAKPARHHGSTHLNRQKELVIVKLSGNIPDKSREVAKFVRKGQRKVPPSVDLSSLPLRTARSSSPERDSGSSTVAIDNKIEQAMDLVKSHLMYAVREEVEVLKEQIKELMERLSQLEYENNILRAAATPDTLAKLTPQTQPSQPPPSSSS